MSALGLMENISTGTVLDASTFGSSVWRCMEEYENLKYDSIGVLLDALLFTLFVCLYLGRWRVALALFLATSMLVDTDGDICKMCSGETLTSRALRRKQRAARLGCLKSIPAGCSKLRNLFAWTCALVSIALLTDGSNFGGGLLKPLNQGMRWQKSTLPHRPDFVHIGTTAECERPFSPRLPGDDSKVLKDGHYDGDESSSPWSADLEASGLRWADVHDFEYKATDCDDLPAADYGDEDISHSASWDNMGGHYDGDGSFSPWSAAFEASRLRWADVHDFEDKATCFDDFSAADKGDEDISLSASWDNKDGHDDGDESFSPWCAALEASSLRWADVHDFEDEATDFDYFSAADNGDEDIPPSAFWENKDGHYDRDEYCSPWSAAFTAFGLIWADVRGFDDTEGHSYRSRWADVLDDECDSCSAADGDDLLAPHISTEAWAEVLDEDGTFILCYGLSGDSFGLESDDVSLLQCTQFRIRDLLMALMFAGNLRLKSQNCMTLDFVENSTDLEGLHCELSISGNLGSSEMSISGNLGSSRRRASKKQRARLRNSSLCLAFHSALEEAETYSSSVLDEAEHLDTASHECNIHDSANGWKVESAGPPSYPCALDVEGQCDKKLRKNESGDPVDDNSVFDGSGDLPTSAKSLGPRKRRGKKQRALKKLNSTTDVHSVSPTFSGDELGRAGYDKGSGNAGNLSAGSEALFEEALSGSGHAGSLSSCGSGHAGMKKQKCKRRRPGKSERIVQGLPYGDGEQPTMLSNDMDDNSVPSSFAGHASFTIADNQLR